MLAGSLLNAAAKKSLLLRPNVVFAARLRLQPHSEYSRHCFKIRQWPPASLPPSSSPLICKTISSSSSSSLSARRILSFKRSKSSSRSHSTSSEATPPPAPTKTTTTTIATSESSSSSSSSSSESATSGGGWWTSAPFWGGLGALAAWGMSGSAVYDALQQGPDVISVPMTCVLIVYSSLFTRWAYVVIPQNLLLCSCHITNVTAQSLQLKRAFDYQTEIDAAYGDIVVAIPNEPVKEEEEEENKSWLPFSRQTSTVEAAAAGAGAAVLLAGTIWSGPYLRQALIVRNHRRSIQNNTILTWLASDTGPFTIHFWAPLSKWAISGASLLDWNRPVDKISTAQYSALTLTGFFFSRYSLLVKPVNYSLCSVNVALFVSSAYHLCRKLLFSSSSSSESPSSSDY